MCAQNGQPSCGCAHGGDPSGHGTPGGAPLSEDVNGTPRFTQAITQAAPLKAEVNRGWNVPQTQPGQMMTSINGGTTALYQDIYGTPDGSEYLVYPGTWGTVVTAGRP
jgi:hypothetical protein